MIALTISVLLVGFHMPLALHMTTANNSRIPNRLIFNYAFNLLREPEALPLHAANVQKTINAHQGMKVEFFDDAECYAAITAVHSEALAHYFQDEPWGWYKSDLCRLAQLAQEGGYYFDNDIEVLPNVDIRNFIPEEASFVSVIASNSAVGIFQAVVGVASNHPIIRHALNLTYDYYVRGAFSNGSFHSDPNISQELITKEEVTQCRSLGSEIMAEAFKWYYGDDIRTGAFSRETCTDPEKYQCPDWFNQAYLFKEDSDVSKYDVEAQPSYDQGCNILIADEKTNKALFFSRFLGGGVYCRKPTVVNLNATSSKPTTVNFNATSSKQNVSTIRPNATCMSNGWKKKKQ